MTTRTLRSNKALIKRWAQHSASANVLELTHNAGKAIGFGYRQGNSIKLTSNSVRVVLLKKVYNGDFPRARLIHIYFEQDYY
ncbi:RNase A-like domain-containing protein [Serratia ficaria]|uniref:RNase A-like domain-containing protein n=1 Tax=Serratia ficaria TaxID=61651 RepID=UPI0037043E14